MPSKSSRNTLNTPIRNLNSDIHKNLKKLPQSLLAVHQKYTLAIEALLNITFQKAQAILFTTANTTTSNTLAIQLFDDNKNLKNQKKQIISELIKDINLAFSQLAAPQCKLDELCEKNDLPDQQLTTLKQCDEENALIMTNIQKYIADVLLTKNKINILKAVGIGILFEHHSKKLSISSEAKKHLTATFNETLVNASNHIYNAIQMQLNAQGIACVSTAANKSSIKQKSLQVIQNQKHEKNHEITQALESIFNPLIIKNTLTEKEQLTILNATQQELLTLSSLNTLNDITALIIQTQKKLKITGIIPDHTLELIRLSSITFKVINQSLHLDDKIKTFINRLLVPTIKTTLIDKDFFNQSRHPLRVLLNEINTFGLGWQHSEDPACNSHIIKTIDRLTADICQNYESNNSVFLEALNELKSIQAKDEKTLSLLNSRLTFGAKGKQLAKDADNIAKSTIKSELERLKPSAVICVFAENLWQKVLTVTALHPGVDSPQWAKHMALFQELCNLATPCQSNTEKNNRINRLPGFMLHLQRSLALCAHSAFNAEEIIESLSHTFTQCLNGKTAKDDFILKNSHNKETPNPNNIEQAYPATKNNKPFNGTVFNDKAFNSKPVNAESFNSESDNNKVKNKSNSSVNASKNNSDAKNKTAFVESLNTESPSQTGNKDQQKPYDELKQNVLSFTRGMLFDLMAPNKSVVRCRLAAIIKQTNHYIFINRNGIKIAQYSLDETIHAIKEQRLAVIENNNGVFDTALEEVVSGMRKNKDDKLSNKY